MLEINLPKARVATTTEVRKNFKETLEDAQEGVVYVVANNQKLGAVIGLKHLELLEAALEREAEERMIAVAAQRLKGIREGTDELLDEDEFWERVKHR